jgi:hypothetical protein
MTVSGNSKWHVLKGRGELAAKLVRRRLFMESELLK